MVIFRLDETMEKNSRIVTGARERIPEAEAEPGRGSRARKRVRKRAPKQLPSVQWSVLASQLSAPYLQVCVINIKGQ